MNLHRRPRLPLCHPSRFRSTLFLVALTAVGSLMAPSRATAQLSSVGSVNALPIAGISVVLGTDTAYDPIHQVYLVIMAYGKAYGQWVNSSGAAVGAPFRIGNSDSCPWGNYPRAAFSPDANSGQGGFLVTWHQQSSCPSGSDRVNAQIVAYPNGPISAQQVLSSSTSYSNQGPAVAYSKTSQRFLVVWNASFKIEGRGVGNDGMPITPAVTIVDSPNGAGSGAQHPSLTWNPSTDQFGLAFAGFKDGSSAFVGFRRIQASNGAVYTTANFGSTVGTFSTDVDVNPSTGHFLMGWSNGGTSSGADIDANGTVVATGLLSSRLGTPTSFSSKYNPVSGTLLAVSEDGSKEVYAAELNGNGAPITTSAAITAGASTGSFFPRVTAHATEKKWSVSMSRNQSMMADQIVSTSSSNGGGSATLGSPPPTGGGGSGGGSGGGGSSTYTLTITPPTGGTLTTAGITCGVGGVSCTTTYSSGFPVALTATPASGYTFGSWTGDCVNGQTTMTANRTCGATFNSSGGGGGGGGTGPFTLTINKPTGGTITTAGITCGTGGNACSTQYASGFQVALNASAAAGYTFGGWTGDCASGGATTMSTNRTCGATFNSTSGGGGTTYVLTISPAPTGGTITTAGINCGVGGSTCSASFASGFQVALTATAAAGYTFGSWGGACASGGATTMTTNRTCSATFNSTSGGGGGGGTGPFTLTIVPPTGGKITTAGINCGLGSSTCTTQYSSGFPVALTATVGAGYTFGGWTGDCAPNGTTSMTTNRTCGATFNSTSGGGGGTYTLTIAPPTGGTITTAGINCGVGGATCSASYASGFQVALTATPAAGYTFGSWSGDCASGGTTTMTTNRVCSASFNSTSGGGGSGPFTLAIANPALVNGVGGIVSGAGIQCYPGSQGFCSRNSITSGTSITLAAYPNSASVFLGWSGAGCSSTMSITSSRTCTPLFGAKP